MTRRNEAITISCTPQEKASLEALAEEYECMWGDRPNISALIKAIANGVIPLGEPVPNAQIRVKIAQLEQQLKSKKKLLK